MDFLPQITLFEGVWGWISQISLILATTFCLDMGRRFGFRHLLKRFKETKTPWDHALVDAISAPLGLLIWILGVSLVANIVDTTLHPSFFSILPTVRKLAVSSVILWFFLRLIQRGESSIKKDFKRKGKELDPTTFEAGGKILRACVSIIGALTILQTLGVSISGLLAFGGIGGVAVGFASKDLLANFFGALIIYWDRPFKVGDWVRSSDRQIEGFVEHVGWRVTRIRTFDRRPLYVPNSVFSSITVENASRMTHRRIREMIGIRYADIHVTASIVSEIRQMLKSHPNIDQEMLTVVNFHEFGPSALQLLLSTYTKATKWADFCAVKQELLLSIHAIIERLGAEIAFPTSTLHFGDPLPFAEPDPKVQVSLKKVK